MNRQECDKLIESYVEWLRQGLSTAAALLTGQYGVKNMYVGVPVVIGASGIERIVEVKFTPSERAAFRKSVKSVENLVAITKKLQRESKKKR